ncbi:MAG: hypothetical protein ACOYU3_09295 [Bacillota bacterium]
MLKILMGKKGVGKTKRIIQMANETSRDNKGNSVFIDDDNRYMFEIKRPVRFIDASEYNIDSAPMFLGFVAGLMANDYDLETLYIDGFLKIVNSEQLDSFGDFFKRLDKLTSDLNVIISIKGDPNDVPDDMKAYLMD